MQHQTGLAVDLLFTWVFFFYFLWLQTDTVQYSLFILWCYCCVCDLSVMRKSAWPWRKSWPRKQLFPVTVWAGGRVGGHCTIQLSSIHMAQRYLRYTFCWDRTCRHGHNTSKPAKRKSRYAIEVSKCSKEHPKLFELKAQGEVSLTQISNLFNTYWRGCPISVCPCKVWGGSCSLIYFSP